MFSIPRLSFQLSALLVLIGMVRIILSYADTAQAFDEPCHVAAGIEYLDRGTYTLDPVHPPLSRIAIALPLYAAGERYPVLAASDPGAHNYNVVGNHILYDSGHLRRNLFLARIGVLPFFVLGALTTFLWTLRVGTHWAALLAVFLYTTTPTILAFSSIAYTDIVAASTQMTALFVFSLWLEAPTGRHALWLGLSGGLAFLAKLTSVLFLPAAGVCMLFVWLLTAGNYKKFNFRRRSMQMLGAFVLAAIVIWAGYRFSLKPIRQATGWGLATMPSFQHFPLFMRSTMRDVLLQNRRLPAPELLSGVSQAWVLNRIGSASYLFGEIKSGGWWYFYLCALGVKLPLPLLILFAIGLVSLVTARRRDLQCLPLAGLVGVLLITTHVSYQVGIRHILVCLPLITVVAATGVDLWRTNASHRPARLMFLAVLILWQAGESARAQPDFIAYFNELSGKDPSRVLVTGCDLDCGQDLYRLAAELRARHVDRLTLAVWSSADPDRSGLPPYEAPWEAGSPNGWIAVSSRALRTGDVLHRSLSPNTFDWLKPYTPVANVGKTIKLYYVSQPSKQN